MAFKLIPNSIAGVQLPLGNLSKGPLASLFGIKKSESLVYPNDLATNPAHCHVVQIQIYDYDTEFGVEAKNGLNKAGEAINSLSKESMQETATGAKEKVKTLIETKGADVVNQLSKVGKDVGSQALGVVQQVGNPKTYKPRKQTKVLSTVSLYMPDSLSVEYSANYSQVSMTKELGILGYASSTITELGGPGGFKADKFLGSKSSIEAGTKALAMAGSALGRDSTAIEGVVGQAAGQIVNPQMQLIYEGVDFRTFSLQFMFTPKSSSEAETVKKIIDTFIYYSSPDIATVGDTNDPTNVGRYLVPPQLFDVKFKFTGKTGLAGTIQNAFNKALSNIGLDYFVNNNNPQDVIDKAKENQYLFSIGECVLQDIQVDHAPNGWAAFENGQPVQTNVTLTFKETNILTKSRVNNPNKTKK